MFCSSFKDLLTVLLDALILLDKIFLSVIIECFSIPSRINEHIILNDIELISI